MPSERKGFVSLTHLTRPDHPSEKRPLLMRVDLIGLVTCDSFNYSPDDAAPVQLLPNARMLKGEATCVFTVTGGQFFVNETPAEVMAQIEMAHDGQMPKPDYTPPGHRRPAAKLVQS